MKKNIFNFTFYVTWLSLPVYGVAGFIAFIFSILSFIIFFCHLFTGSSVYEIAVQAVMTSIFSCAAWWCYFQMRSSMATLNFDPQQ